jgi:hypothetical protein
MIESEPALLGAVLDRLDCLQLLQTERAKYTHELSKLIKNTNNTVKVID